MTLANHTVLISGANRGIGAALVRELLKSDIRKIAARSIGSLPDFGDSRVVPLQLDVTDDESVRAASSAAADVDILIKNAGTAAFGDWLSSDRGDHAASCRSDATSRRGGAPNIRLYSRLNCDGLS